MIDIGAKKWERMVIGNKEWACEMGFNNYFQRMDHYSCSCAPQ